MQQQFPKYTKLANGIVSDLGCSCSLLSENSYTYMCLHDHISIIRSITNGKSDFIKLFNKFNNLCFLRGRHSTKHQRINPRNNIQQIMLSFSKRQSRPIDNRTDSNGERKRLSAFLLKSLDKGLQTGLGVNQEALINHSTRYRDILSSL